MVLVVGLAAAALAQSQAPRVPVPPIKTSLGPMPGVAELPSRPALPDVLTFENGDRVATAAQWTKRREEMKRILAYYATGLMPPAPGNVRGRILKSSAVLSGAVSYRLVHLSFGPGSKYGFDVALFVPASAKGRVPVVVFPTFGPTPGGTPLATMVRPPEQGKGLDALVIPLGDQTARAAEAAAATPQKSPVAPPAASASDPESAAAAHAELFRRGYALAIYHYQDTGEDTIGRMPDGSWAFRTTRYYPAYPDYDWGLAAGWAWGLSRCIDYLETQTVRRPRQVHRRRTLEDRQSRVDCRRVRRPDRRGGSRGQRRRRDRSLPLQRRARRRSRGPRRHDAQVPELVLAEPVSSSPPTSTSCPSISTGSSRWPLLARSSRSKAPTIRTACPTR